MTATLAPAPTITVTPATDSDVLDAAADYIEEHGWCQGAMVDANDRVCMMGAITAIVWPEFLTDTVPMYLVASADSHVAQCRHYEHVLGYHLHAPVTWWNDHPGRTADEVIAALRGLAESLR